MALLSPPPKMQFFGNDGLPLSGGKVYTYEKDTTVPLATYTDSTGSVANTNPVILDAQGRADIWLQILPYSFVIYNSLNVLQSCSGSIEFPSAALSGSDIAAWSDIVVYDFPDQVAGSDGYTYRCVGTNVLDDDPVGSVTGNWVNLSSIASPALTGTPTAPTAAEGTDTTQIATTAFVQLASNISANISGGRNREIIGGDITVSSNTLTITPCGCWDSTRRIWLETTIDKTVVIPSAANTIYHIFLVRLVSDASFEFRAYTTEAAPASDTQINAYRWVGFWRTNGSNACVSAYQVDGVLFFLAPADNIITSSLTTSPSTYSHTALLPVSKISSILYGGAQPNYSAAADSISIYLGSIFLGIQIDTSYSYQGWGVFTTWVPFSTSLTFTSGEAGKILLCHAVKLRFS